MLLTIMNFSIHLVGSNPCPGCAGVSRCSEKTSPAILPAPQVSDAARDWVHAWKKEKKTTKNSLPKKVNPGRLAALWIE